jgi:hypothetical protein
MPISSPSPTRKAHSLGAGQQIQALATPRELIHWRPPLVPGNDEVGFRYSARAGLSISHRFGSRPSSHESSWHKLRLQANARQKFGCSRLRKSQPTAAVGVSRGGTDPSIALILDTTSHAASPHPTIETECRRHDQHMCSRLSIIAGPLKRRVVLGSLLVG